MDEILNCFIFSCEGDDDDTKTSTSRGGFNSGGGIEDIDDNEGQTSPRLTCTVLKVHL